MSVEVRSLPTILIRGRSVMALVVAPDWPLEDWLAALDEQMRRTAGLFDHRPVVANLAAASDAGVGRKSVLAALEALAARDLRVIGVEGVDPVWLAGTRWALLPAIPQGRETILREGDSAGEGRGGRAAAAAPPPSASAAPSLLVDRPVRSGQAIVFEQGDVTIVGSVASGAEVIAGGSIHVYGALRGRAIAGVAAGEARIFCRKLEAELLAVDGLYRTAENWGPDLHGRAVQVRREMKTLALVAFD